MGSYITLIGSMVIGAMFMLNLFSYYGDLVDHQSTRMQEMWTQEWTASLAKVVDSDFHKMGSAIGNPNQAILSITDSTDITFLADVDNDLVAETVRYYISSKAAASSTENPNDRILYRVVDGTPELDIVSGVTMFSVKMLDWNGNYTANKEEVYSLEITMQVESMFAIRDGIYGRAIWHRRITPENMVRITGIKIS